MSTLFVAWRGGSNSQRPWGWGPVGKLEFDRSVYRFCYTVGARSLPGFRPFPQMEDLDQVYESETLFPIFANRLLSPSRREYDAYLRWGGFDANLHPDPISILGVTEGLLATDFIEVFPCPTPDADGCYINKFFLHGIRWMPPAAIDRIDRLQAGEHLVVSPEPTNPFDPYAVAVSTEDQKIGYVPRYLAREVHQLLGGCGHEFMDVSVLRVNRDAPLQQRVLCQMRTCWPEGFRPCSDESFQPIPVGIASRC